MAPIQSQSSYTVHESSSNTIPSTCHCGSSFVNDLEWWLPISRRGYFFQDSFFEDARAHFDAAVKEVLSKWGEMKTFSDLWNYDTSSSLVDNLSRYRLLKTSNLIADNLVTTLISDNNSHKIVMDVHDFMDGEIKVKLLDEKEILVEGQGHNLLSSQSFSRRFCFPETANMAAVTSVLSSDGVLTIEAPRVNTPDNFVGTTSTHTRISSEATNFASAGGVDGKEGNDKVFYCKGCSKKIGQWETAPEPPVTHHEEMKMPIKINATITKDANVSTASSASQVISSKLASNSHAGNINIEKVASGTKENEKTNSKVAEQKLSADNKTNVTSVNDIKTSSSGKSYSVPVSTCFNTLPVITGGLFFSDSVFDDTRKDFQSAVQEVLSKWGEKSTIIDDLTSYRNLRNRDLREENQATKVTEDESSHKVVLDVHDFMNGGDITVKTINNREIVIEGQTEKQEGGSKSQKRFLKRFVLPGDVDFSSVTSVMSSDGVLTVNAPKKPQSAQPREFIIPVSIEEANDGSQRDVNQVNKTQEALNEIIKKNSHQTSQDSFLSSLKKQSSHLSTLNESNKTSSLLASRSVNTHEISPSREHIIPIHVEGECNYSNTDTVKNKIKADQELRVTHTTNSSDKTENSPREFKGPEASSVEDQKLRITRVASNCDKTESSSRGFKGLESSVEKTRNLSSVSRQSNFAGKQIDNSQFAMNRTKTVTDEKVNPIHINNCFASSSNGRYLPIARRGPFFSDSFFEGFQEDFETAVSEVLVKSREHIKEGEMMNTYRNLRQRNLKVENQALRVHEDQNSFKVVLDVKDFTDGDITVSVEGEELVIEGRTEKTENHASDSLTFSHRFLLPEATDFTAITSAISSDGVLTINSRKTENSGGDAIRKTSSEAESKHESHDGGNHYWEKKNVKESSQQSKGFSSQAHCSSYHTQQQHSSVL